MKKIILLSLLIIFTSFVGAKDFSELSEDEKIEFLWEKVQSLEKENKELNERMAALIDHALLEREKIKAKEMYEFVLAPLYSEMLLGAPIPSVDEVNSFKDAYMPMAKIFMTLSGGN